MRSHSLRCCSYTFWLQCTTQLILPLPPPTHQPGSVQLDPAPGNVQPDRLVAPQLLLERDALPRALQRVRGRHEWDRAGHWGACRGKVGGGSFCMNATRKPERSMAMGGRQRRYGGQVKEGSRR